MATRFATPPETQFIPRSDDEENLWDAVAILKERKHEYFVEWAGIDPATGKPWEDSWVLKSDCTNELIKEWKEKKRELERNRKRKKSVNYSRPSKRPKSTSSLLISSSPHESPFSLNSPSKSSVNGTPRSGKFKVSVELPVLGKRRAVAPTEPGPSTHRKKRKVYFDASELPHSEKDTRDQPQSVGGITEEDFFLPSGSEDDNDTGHTRVAHKNEKQRDVSEEVLPPPPLDDVDFSQLADNYPNDADQYSWSLPLADSQIHSSPLRHSKEAASTRRKLAVNGDIPNPVMEEEEEGDIPEVDPADVSKLVWNGNVQNRIIEEEAEANRLTPTRITKFADVRKKKLTLADIQKGNRKITTTTRPTRSSSQERSSATVQQTQPRNGGLKGVLSRIIEEEDPSVSHETRVAGKSSSTTISFEKASFPDKGLTKPTGNGLRRSATPQRKDEVTKATIQRAQKRPKLKSKHAIEFESDSETSVESRLPGSAKGGVHQHDTSIRRSSVDRTALASMDGRAIHQGTSPPPPNQQALAPNSSNEIRKSAKDDPDNPSSQSYTGSIVPETLPLNSSLDPTSVSRSKQPDNISRFSNVPDISPSKFQPSLPQLGVDAPSSPVEDFSPARPSSTIETTESSRELKRKYMSSKQPAFDALQSTGEEAHSIESFPNSMEVEVMGDSAVLPSRSRDIDVTSVELQTMEDAFVDYSGGAVSHRTADDELDVETSLALATAGGSPDKNTESQPNLSHFATSDPNIQPKPVQALAPSVFALPVSPSRAQRQTSRKQITTPSATTGVPQLLTNQLTPRTLRRKNLLAEYTDDVPEGITDQLDKALQVLNYKSLEIQDLKIRLTVKEAQFLDREREFQGQMDNRRLEYEAHIQELTENEQTFRDFYLKASARASELELSYNDSLQRTEQLERQVTFGIAQVRKTFEVQLQSLQEDLVIASGRADLFEEQAAHSVDIRHLAGEHPMLVARVEELTARLNESKERERYLSERTRSDSDATLADRMREEISRLMEVESDLRSINKALRKELSTLQEMRLDSQDYSVSKAISLGSENETERIICRWAVNSKGVWCNKELMDREELKQHLMDYHLIVPS